MFHCGDLIVYGNNGVCEVTDIAPLENSTDNRIYYILKNRLSNGVAYVPVDSPVYMRAVMSKDEVQNIISAIPTLKTDEFENINVRDASRVYRETLQTYDTLKIVALIKHIIASCEKKREQGKKITTTEERFLDQAKKVIESEFSVALNIEIDEVSNYILKCVNKGC